MTLPPLEFRPGQDSTNTAPVYGSVPLPGRLQYLLADPARRILRTSLLLEVKRMDDGRWLATNPEIMTHGVGNTPDAAVRDYQSMLIDLFLELLESENVLAPHLHSELEQLRTVLVEPNLP